MQSPLAFMHIIEKLKNIPRRGWVIRNIPDPESDCDHMYRMAMMVLSLKEPGDRFKLLQMALVHDVGESLIGDITPSDGISKDEKFEKEELAIEYLSLLLQDYHPIFANDVRELFREFELGITKEAQICCDIDIFERATQAFEYEKRSLGTKKLDDMLGDLNDLVTSEVKTWAASLIEERNLFWERKVSSVKAVYVIGGPGVGKGTQCSLFSAKHNAHHVCAGELLREEQKRPGSKYSKLIETHITKGITVPALLTVSLLREKMEEAHALGKKIILVDGFPRSEEQAQEFEQEFSLRPMAIALRCANDEQIARLSMRSGTSGRDDDQSEQGRRDRVEAFARQNAPVEIHLGARQLLVYTRFEEAVFTVLESYKSDQRS